MKTSALLSGFIVLASFSEMSAATSTMLNFPESYLTGSFGQAQSHGNGMVGYTFTVVNTVTVTQVGWYDGGKDGLSRDYQVGLWKTSTNFDAGASITQLLGAANSGVSIPGGTSASLNRWWRVVDLAVPLELTPGYYQIAGMDTAATTDPLLYFSSSLNEFPDPNIQIGAFFYPGGAAATSPTFNYTDSNGFYKATGMQIGPMLFVVPEPSAVLLAAGATMMLAARRRR